VVGVLFVVASAATIAGGVLALPVDDAHALRDLSGQHGRVITGALLELVLVAAVVAIAAMLFGVLRRFHEGVALAYLAARTLEGVALLGGAMAAMVAVALSDRAGVGSSESVASLVVETRTWSVDVGSLILFGAGAVLLYSVLYRARLVPTWLSAWGLIGAVLILARGVLRVYEVDLSAPVEGLLTAPVGVNEMVLAAWLIVKGFATSGRPSIDDGAVIRGHRGRPVGV